MPITYEQIDSLRRIIITAIFSDETLFDRLALKGGNALRLVYQVQARASLDLDLSLDGDLADFEETGRRLCSLLRHRLDAAGYELFDETFERRPHTAEGRWGGYQLVFKILDKKTSAALGAHSEARQRHAVTIDPQQHRKWIVEISKFEYCDAKQPYQMNAQTIYVYTPEMIVIEKFRAICQQMPSYTPRRSPTPRARDFYDIHEITTQLPIRLDTPERAQLARAIFEAKSVPLALLRSVKDHREFHAQDWPSVEGTVIGDLRGFDHYFDYVVTLAEKLEPLWAE